MEKLSQLTGAEFEIEFMKDMIRHHYQAVIEGAHYMERAYDEELSLCRIQGSVGSPQFFQHIRDLVCNPLAFRFGQSAGDRELGKSGQVIAQHITLHPTNGRDHRASLVNYLQAVAFVMDHLLKAANLPFDPTQSRYLAAMIHRIVVCGGGLLSNSH